MIIIFGWRDHVDPKGEWLLPCASCKGVQLHAAYHVRRWFGLFLIPVVPLPGRRYVVCSRCEHRRRVSADEEEQLEKTGHAFSGLRRLQELDPEAAGRIMTDIDWRRASMADLGTLVDQALKVALSVEKAEARRRAQGRPPPLL